MVASLRLATLAALTLMLLDVVLVIDRHEQTPSRLIVLMDTSESMGLADPYDESTARRYAGGFTHAGNRWRARCQSHSASPSDLTSPGTRWRSSRKSLPKDARCFHLRFRQQGGSHR